MPSTTNYSRSYQPSLDGSSAGSLDFDYEDHLPKSMCGASVLSKLGLIEDGSQSTPQSSQRQGEHRRRKFGGIFRRKPRVHRNMYGVDLQPINTLFVTEQDFISTGLIGNTLSGETSEQTVSADSLSTRSFPQFDVKTGKTQLVPVTELPEESPERASAPTTPKTTNTVTIDSPAEKHFDFDEVVPDNEEGGGFLPQISPANRLRNKLKQKKNRKKPKPEQPSITRHPLPNPVEIVPRERTTSTGVGSRTAAEEDLANEYVPKDDFSISTKDTGEAVPQEEPDNRQSEDRVIHSMQALISRQQDNLHTLADRTQKYRDRLCQSQDKVHELHQSGMESKEVITKLKFEREAFEAEAMWLREELKSIKKMLGQSEQTRHIAIDAQGDTKEEEIEEPMQLFVADKPASSEQRWKRSQAFVLTDENVPNYVDTSTTVVEEAPSPACWREVAPTAPPIIKRVCTTGDVTSPLASPKMSSPHQTTTTTTTTSQSIYQDSEPETQSSHLGLEVSSRGSSQYNSKPQTRFFPPSPISTQFATTIDGQNPILKEILNNAQRLASPTPSPSNHQSCPFEIQNDACEYQDDENEGCQRLHAHRFETQNGGYEHQDEENLGEATHHQMQSKDKVQILNAEEDEQSQNLKEPEAVSAIVPIASSSPLKRYLEATQKNKSTPISSFQVTRSLRGKVEFQGKGTQPKMPSSVESADSAAISQGKGGPDKIASPVEPVVTSQAEPNITPLVEPADLPVTNSVKPNQVTQSLRGQFEFEGKGAQPKMPSSGDPAATSQEKGGPDKTASPIEPVVMCPAKLNITPVVGPVDMFATSPARPNLAQIVVSPQVNTPEQQLLNPSPLRSPRSPRSPRRCAVNGVDSNANRAREYLRTPKKLEGVSPYSERVREYLRVKQQASASTMSFAKVNAEMRWVKSQQHLLDDMRTGIDCAPSLSSSPQSLPNFMNLNSRVDQVRMNLVKASLVASEQTEEKRRLKSASNGPVAPKGIIRSPGVGRAVVPGSSSTASNKRVTIQVPSVRNHPAMQGPSHYQIRKKNRLAGKDSLSEQSI